MRLQAVISIGIIKCYGHLHGIDMETTLLLKEIKTTLNRYLVMLLTYNFVVKELANKA